MGKHCSIYICKNKRLLVFVQNLEKTPRNYTKQYGLNNWLNRYDTIWDPDNYWRAAGTEDWAFYFTSTVLYEEEEFTDEYILKLVKKEQERDKRWLSNKSLFVHVNLDEFEVRWLED